MKNLLNLGQTLSAFARLTPDRLGARDLDRVGNAPEIRMKEHEIRRLSSDIGCGAGRH